MLTLVIPIILILPSFITFIIPTILVWIRLEVAQILEDFPQRLFSFLSGPDFIITFLLKAL